MNTINFKQLRLDAGLTLKEVAEKNKLSKYAVGELEKGMFGIATNVTFKLLDFYGFKLVRGEDQKDIPENELCLDCLTYRPKGSFCDCTDPDLSPVEINPIHDGPLCSNCFSSVLADEQDLCKDCYDLAESIIKDKKQEEIEKAASEAGEFDTMPICPNCKDSTTASDLETFGVCSFCFVFGKKIKEPTFDYECVICKGPTMKKESYCIACTALSKEQFENSWIDDL